MDYNKKIIKRFIEMPLPDSSQDQHYGKQLGNPSEKDMEINDTRYKNLKKFWKVIDRVDVVHPEIGKLYIELLENPTGSNCNVYLIDPNRGRLHVAGNIDAIDQKYPFLAVQSTYVLKPYTRQGYASKMYDMLVNYLGGLVSDATITDDALKRWISMGLKYYSYLVDINGEVEEIGQFSKSMLTSKDVRFMVTVDEFDEE